MKVTTKGQITIPKGIRKRYGIHAGTEVEVADSHGEIVIRKAGSKNAVDRVYGLLKDRTPWRSTDDLISRLRDVPLPLESSRKGRPGPLPRTRDGR